MRYALGVVALLSVGCMVEYQPPPPPPPVPVYLPPPPPAVTLAERTDDAKMVVADRQRFSRIESVWEGIQEYVDGTLKGKPLSKDFCPAREAFVGEMGLPEFQSRVAERCKGVARCLRVFATGCP